MNDLTSGPVNEFDLNLAGYDKQVIILQGELTKTTAFYFPITKETHWLLKNDTNHSIKYGKRGDDVKMLPSVLARSWGLITVYKMTVIEAGVRTEIMDIRSSGPRPVNNCVIEDNYSRILRRDIHDNGAFDVKDLKHTLVKVNTNAIGTVIRGWYLSGWNENDKDKVVELMENDPLTHERVPILYPGRSHMNTSLHRDGTDGGHVLLPFASRQDTIKGQREEYRPDTSRWCSYRFRLTENAMSLVMKNPTTRTVGTPLFLGFVSARDISVKVEFDNDYSISNSPLTIPPYKTVTGILLFEIGNKWTPYSSWTCEGRPLSDMPQ